MSDQRKMDSEPRRNRDGLSGSGSYPTPDRQRAQKGKRYVDITAMIRSLQRTEGLTDCFRSGLGDCDQFECAWRQYCLGNAKSVWTESDNEF
jgi:hypothetical protein